MINESQNRRDILFMGKSMKVENQAERMQSAPALAAAFLRTVSQSRQNRTQPCHLPVRFAVPIGTAKRTTAAGHSTEIRKRPHPRRTLDSTRARHELSYPHSSNRTMGKQYNKVIKQKRRAAYLKRKKAAAKAAKKEVRPLSPFASASCSGGL